MIGRRDLLLGAGAGAGLLAMPTPLLAQQQRVLRFMPQAALVVLDPGNSPGWITRNHRHYEERRDEAGLVEVRRRREPAASLCCWQ